MLSYHLQAQKSSVCEIKNRLISCSIIPTASVHESGYPTPSWLWIYCRTAVSNSKIQVVESLTQQQHCWWKTFQPIFSPSSLFVAICSFEPAGSTRVKWIAPTQRLGSDVFISCAYLHCGPWCSSPVSTIIRRLHTFHGDFFVSLDQGVLFLCCSQTIRSPACPPASLPEIPARLPGCESLMSVCRLLLGCSIMRLTRYHLHADADAAAVDGDVKAQTQNAKLPSSTDFWTLKSGRLTPSSPPPLAKKCGNPPRIKNKAIDARIRKGCSDAAAFGSALAGRICEPAADLEQELSVGFVKVNFATPLSACRGFSATATTTSYGDFFKGWLLSSIAIPRDYAQIKSISVLACSLINEGMRRKPFRQAGVKDAILELSLETKYEKC